MWRTLLRSTACSTGIQHSTARWREWGAKKHQATSCPARPALQVAFLQALPPLPRPWLPCSNQTASPALLPGKCRPFTPPPPKRKHASRRAGRQLPLVGGGAVRHCLRRPHAGPAHPGGVGRCPHGIGTRATWRHGCRTHTDLRFHQRALQAPRPVRTSRSGAAPIQESTMRALHPTHAPPPAARPPAPAAALRST